jgi:hypothetical protein
MAGTPDEVEAYKEGRADERGREVRRGSGEAARPVVVENAPRAAELEAAYRHGRDRERMRRRGSPLLSLIVVLVVVAAGLFVYLAIRNGSFSGGGAAVDRGIDNAQKTIDAPLKGAALKAGDALQKAGQSLK